MNVWTFVPNSDGTVGHYHNSYVEELNRVIESHSPVICVEHDIEYADAVLERMLAFVLADPTRIHVGPYLYNAGDRLMWAHRNISRVAAKDFDSTEHVFTPALHDVPGHGVIAAPISVRFQTYIVGGEPESDWFALGFTYIPLAIWRQVYPSVKDVDWLTLSDEISKTCVSLGYRPMIHWDCVVNHTNVKLKRPFGSQGDRARIQGPAQ